MTWTRERWCRDRAEFLDPRVGSRVGFEAVMMFAAGWMLRAALDGGGWHAAACVFSAYVFWRSSKGPIEPPT